MSKLERKDRKFKFETLQLHIGQENPDPVTDARAVPIYLTSSYVFHNSEHAADRFGLRDAGNIYGRLTNPTQGIFEERIAALEGGVAALAVGSGAAALAYTFQAIAHAGDHIVAAKNIYGGTYNLFNVTMRKLGIDFTFVSPDADEEEIQAAFKPNTKAVFGETISNPSLDILDIERFAKVAHKNGVPLIVDNTFATPINCRVFDWGADIVTHSTTKYMEGHASTIGGAIVDSGNFDWTQNDKFPGLTTPDESYHGITYTEAFGKGAYITKATVQLMRDLGSMPSPHDAFLLNVGLESLHLRVARHCENAKKVANYLKSHEKIAWVNCPMLEDDKQYAKAQKYMPNGTCGVVSFGIKGGREAATKFMDSLKLAAIVTHVADARSCCLHPASTTHRQLTDEQLEECGVSADLVRFSCGIEDSDDIIADIEQALAQI